MLKWFRIIIGILLAIISILWAMIICGERGWGIIICIPIAVGIFILLYGFFWLCMFSAEKITNAYEKVYHEKVVTRTQQAAIENWAKQNHGDLEEKCQTAYAKHSDVISPSATRWQSN